MIVGEKDQATPPHHAETLAERIPDAELERIAEAGHLTPLEQPEAVTEHLERFLRGVHARKAASA